MRQGFIQKEKTVGYFPHQNKERPFVNALCLHGFREADNPLNSSVVLTDVDAMSRLNQNMGRIRRMETFVVMYPHAAIPPVFTDGIMPVQDFTRAIFVFAEGHKEILESYGTTTPIHVCGWAYSDIQKFKPCAKPKKVLFAAIHPNASGFLPSEDMKLNRDTLNLLIPLAVAGKIDLTVRYVNDLEKNGLYKSDFVRYTIGDVRVDKHKDLLQYDLVISHHTLAYISVALGIPTLMMAEWLTPKSGSEESTIVKVANWEKYKHIMMYPLDILSDGDVYDKMQLAGSSEKPILEWKERMIGKPFDPHAVAMPIAKFF